ncbi:UDP-glucuronate 4-epimerase [Roseimicrobium gellanilyticum]|uniref:UDP-glucuronate 4-epimerase n=1 Tax=Roseimicrobium gellanilyticum TaxID=748857 RepID=A0A366H7I0_9BACT|nr:SDR family NAD(P)-dependent oxidoreductase [Roseimicrobium gellanilyticum]RBP37401.1 UDP-glucuronate 4-epimerase [Roseimicrobium gellanilyticum]
MRVLITGGAGFIGSHTTERLLANGHSVTILDNFNDYYDPAIKRENIRAIRDQITLVEGDLREKDDVERAYAAAPVDAVIHLAARAGVRPSIEQPELYIDTNIKGTFNMLEAAKSHGVKRFVFASSSSVYGVNKKVPFAEVDPILQTISPYAMTKMAGEQMCSNYSALYGIRTVCLRFFTVYGPRQRPDLAISKFTRLIHEDKPIDRYGDGSTARDYTFISDIVDGIIGSLEYTGDEAAPKCDIFNLGGSQTVTLNEMIGAIEKALGKKAQINAMPEQPGDVPLTSADVGKASTVLNFKPTTHIDTGIPQFVQWWLEMREKGLR